MADRYHSSEKGEQRRRDRRQDESWQGGARGPQGPQGQGAPGSGQQADGGGYGSQGGGYGSQSSYASHGGYGSQGEASGGGSENRGGHGAQGESRSQGYGTHAGSGPHGGYGPQGDAHWPQANWGPMSQQARSHRRGPKGYARSDERIREDICERLMHSAHIDSSEVTIEVSGGKVLIEGTVPDRRMKHAIEDIADATAGVNDVDNRVRLQQGGSQSESSGSSGTASGLHGQSAGSSSAAKPGRE